MHLPVLPLANLGSFFGVDGVVVLVIGLLIFGRKLPEVGKNLGKTIVEFKKGLNGSYSADERVEEPQEEEEAPAPRRLPSGSRRSLDAPRASSAPSRRVRQEETEEV